MIRRAVLIVAASLVAAAPLTAKEDEKPVEEFVYPAYFGPKKTIAVTKFDAVGSFVGEYGGWDIGGGLASMLITELNKTNRFIVLERADIDQLMQEKQMISNKQASGPDAPPPLLGVQTFIRGSVTEFSQNDKGGGMSFGIKTGGFGGRGESKTATGKVAIDMRLVDAAHGNVLKTEVVKKEIKSKSLSINAGKGLLDFGGESFNRTSLGQATREAIHDAVLKIVNAMETQPWQALIARVDGAKVYVNAGKNANLTPGMKLAAIRTSNVISDPVTGEVLGAEETTVGELTVQTVADRYSVASFSGEGAPEKGDTLRIKP